MTKKQIVQYINALVGVDNMPLKYALEYFKGYQDDKVEVLEGRLVPDGYISPRIFLYMDDRRNVYEVFEWLSEEGLWVFNEYKLN